MPRDEECDNVTAYQTINSKDDRYRFAVIEVCCGLHDHMTGASDPLRPDLAIYMYRWLTMRKDTWREPAGYKPSTRDFDAAVLNLVKMTIRMYSTNSDYQDTPTFGKDTMALIRTSVVQNSSKK